MSRTFNATSRRSALSLLGSFLGSATFGGLGCSGSDSAPPPATEGAATPPSPPVANTPQPTPPAPVQTVAMAPAAASSATASTDKIVKTEDEWKRALTPKQYAVCRMKSTEAPFTGEYWNEHRAGTYFCVACGALLFESKAKFESGTGWPSFFDVAKGARVATTADHTLDMERIEVTCARCGAHLGHVFDDGPKPTGLRYCINSVAIRFEPAA